MSNKIVELTLGGTLQVLVRETEPQVGGTIVTLTLDSFTVTTRGNDIVMFTLPADKQVRVKVSYVDADGNPATVDGDVQWSSSDDNIASVEADPDDSFEAIVRPGETLGQAQINAQVDADIGDGTRHLSTLMDVEVVGGEAVAGVIEPIGELEDMEPPVVDNTLPGGQQPRPDNTLPGQQPQPKPGNELPEHAAPKPGGESRR